MCSSQFLFVHRCLSVFGSVQSRICLYLQFFYFEHLILSIQCFYWHVGRFKVLFVVALSFVLFLFSETNKTVYDVHMNACIPEINQSGREMQETWLGSN